MNTNTLIPITESKSIKYLLIDVLDSFHFSNEDQIKKDARDDLFSDIFLLSSARPICTTECVRCVAKGV